LSRTTRVSRYQKKHSPTHLSWSSSNIYQLLPSTRIHSILPVQFTCLTIFLHNLCPCPLWFTSCLEPSTSYSIHFLPNQGLVFATHGPCHCKFTDIQQQKIFQSSCKMSVKVLSVLLFLSLKYPNQLHSLCWSCIWQGNFVVYVERFDWCCLVCALKHVCRNRLCVKQGLKCVFDECRACCRRSVHKQSISCPGSVQSTVCTVITTVLLLLP